MPGIADAGGEGRVHLDAIARWLQDVAAADLRDAGFEEAGVWVLRRARIRVEAFPRWDEEATLSTFCSGIGRFTAERRTTILAATAKVEAVALWVWLDAESLRPRRFPPEFVEVYAQSAAGREPNSRLRHSEPPDDCESRRWRFRASDVDVAAHVNNSHYWAPLEEETAVSAREQLDAEIEYRDPAQPGEFVVLSSAAQRWITGPAGRIHASILVAGI